MTAVFSANSWVGYEFSFFFFTNLCSLMHAWAVSSNSPSYSSSSPPIQKTQCQVRHMTQWLKVLTTKHDDLRSIPMTHLIE